MNVSDAPVRSVDPAVLEAGSRGVAAYRAYRAHVLSDCRACDRNDCPTEKRLDADASAAAHEYGRLRRGV